MFSYSWFQKISCFAKISDLYLLFMNYPFFAAAFFFFFFREGGFLPKSVISSVGFGWLFFVFFFFFFRRKEIIFMHKSQCKVNTLQDTKQQPICGFFVLLSWKSIYSFGMSWNYFLSHHSFFFLKENLITLKGTHM